MRTKRETETDEQRRERKALEAQQRTERTSVEDQEIDAAIRRSIDLHGA